MPLLCRGCPTPETAKAQSHLHVWLASNKSPDDARFWTWTLRAHDPCFWNALDSLTMPQRSGKTTVSQPQRNGPRSALGGNTDLRIQLLAVLLPSILVLSLHSQIRPFPRKSRMREGPSALCYFELLLDACESRSAHFCPCLGSATTTCLSIYK